MADETVKEPVVKAEKLTPEQAVVARESILAKEAFEKASGEVKAAGKAGEELFITADGVIAPKAGVDTAKAQEAIGKFKEVEGKFTAAETAQNAAKAKVESSITNTATKKAVSEFKNGMFGEFNLAKLEKGYVKGAVQATKDTFSHAWKNDKKIAFGKGAVALGGIYVASRALPSKNADGSDRSALLRTGEAAAGTLMLAGALVGGAVHAR